MTKSYSQCRYESDGHQCQSWFPRDEDEPYICPVHSGILDPSIAIVSEETKTIYIERVNEIRKFVSAMTLDEIAEHRAHLEHKLEELRTEIQTTRQVEREKLNDLSESERDERRKIFLPKKPEKQQKLNQPKVKAPSLKKDPTAYLKSVGIGADLLSMDTDELIAKFTKAQGEKG